jgi:hypothetical protein
MMAVHLQAVGISSEWLTPPEIFAGLRRGGIEVFDLDPCHPGRDNPYCVVPARKTYTEADDGLRQPWEGEVFLNPPFGKRYSHVPWLKRFFADGSGIALCNALTSSNWWHAVVVPDFQVIVFPAGKTKFLTPLDGTPGPEPANGIALIAVGAVACEALKHCGLGWVVVNPRDGRV